jgi:hypothetical protein
LWEGDENIFKITVMERGEFNSSTDFPRLSIYIYEVMGLHPKGLRCKNYQ